MEFQPIRGFEDYLINTAGVIKNKEGTVMRTRISNSGYARINLQKDKVKQTVNVHWLLMTTFNPIADTKNMTVDHADGDRKNNRLSNLRWCYIGENISLEKLRNNDETVFFMNELRRMYSEDEMSDILKTLLNLARLLIKSP